MAFSADYTDYVLRASIGFGAASIVYLANQLPAANEVSSICAIKISSRHPDVQQWLEEVRILSSCKHPNVLQIHAAFTIPPEHDQVAIVTPLIAGGSLLSIMAWRATLPADDQPSGLFRSLSGRRRPTLTRGRLEEEEIKAVVVQVVRGLGYLHSQGIVHRDLKAGNILVDSNGTVLLADLGIGVRCSASAADKEHVGLVGSPCWMSPEIITGSVSDLRSDIWSLGIVLIGSAPYCDLPTTKVLTQIAVGPVPALPSTIDASKSCTSFIGSCLVKDPSARATIRQLERHAFLRKARGSAWLADSLLKGVPPLTHRQEIRRKLSHQSLSSLAPSWNFTQTPSGSTLPSPVRTTHRLPRSPSASSSHSHLIATPSRLSRNSRSRPSLGNSVPSSPKASLSRASVLGPVGDSQNTEADGRGLPMRQTWSAGGRKRTASLVILPTARDLPVNVESPETPFASPSAHTESPRILPPHSTSADVSTLSLTPTPAPILVSLKRERKSMFSWRWGVGS